jgi:hypothetical protein
VSSGKERHWGKMCGGNGIKIGGIGPGVEFSYMMGLRALMDHGHCHHPTAAMGPHSWCQSIQQWANILCKRSTLLNLENIKLLMFIWPFRSQRVDKLLCLIVAGCDGRKTNAEHWWQQRQLKYVMYDPLTAHALGLPRRQYSGMLWSGWKWGLIRLQTNHYFKSGTKPLLI